MSPGRPSRLALPGVLLLAALCRGLHLYSLGAVSPFDPWRHLLLIENIRDGVGFSLFDGQPYIWYGPLWYHLAAAVYGWLPPDWLSALLSLLSVGLFFQFLRIREGPSVAVSGAVMLAALAPAVVYTCGYGSDSFAFFLLNLGLWMSAASARAGTGLLCGLAVGTALVTKLPYAVALPLLLPALRRRRFAIALAAGAAAPIAWAWWRNHRVVSAYPYVFTWDGLATEASRYGPLSTLLPQLHPDVAEAFERMHEGFPLDWSTYPGLVALVAAGLVAALAGLRAGRWDLALACVLGLAALEWAGGPGLATSFRHKLGLLLPLVTALALALEAIRRHLSARARVPGFALAGLLAALCSVGLYREPRRERPLPLRVLTPPERILTQTHYMVPALAWHPEVVAFRYRDRHFIGMPFRPDRFEEFRRAFPEYRAILWHGSTIQHEFDAYLRGSGRYRKEAGSHAHEVFVPVGAAVEEGEP